MIVIREHRIYKVSSTKSSSDESALKLVELSSTSFRADSSDEDFVDHHTLEQL